MTRKLEAVQSAVKSYFERFPRVSIKALSMRTGVPYATLRRILQHEVNDIKDETIFKLIDRVMLRQERMLFLREHYPSLAKVISEQPEQSFAEDVAIDQLKRFRYLDPHNFILSLALTSRGTCRDDIQRLTGERGMMALEEMMETGLLLEERDVIRIEATYRQPLDLEETLHQMGKDLHYFPKGLGNGPLTRVSHMSESVSREVLQKMVALTGEFWLAMERLRESEPPGDIPFFCDVAIATYDKQSLQRSSHHFRQASGSSPATGISIQSTSPERLV
jgi:hypothetical protein